MGIHSHVLRGHGIGVFKATAPRRNSFWQGKKERQATRSLMSLFELKQMLLCGSAAPFPTNHE